ncbi:MAG: glycosyl transferase, family 2 [Bryobacterales bacterium]|nr:glycosyl transferase, family 2 [Bryobacterales bacterium]
MVVVQHLGSSTPAGEASVADAIQHFGAKCVAFPEPFNFSEMNNRGSRAASGELLLFLNDDVEPIASDWLARMVSHLEDPSVGAVGAKLLYPGGAIQHAGIATWLIDGAGHPGRNLLESENWPWLHYTREVSAVTGASMCMRRSDFEKLGGFDPVFPVNYNDVDLCLRLRAAGLSVILDANAVLRHDESQTRRPGTRYDERRLFFRRWGHVVENVDPYYSPHLAQNNEDLSLGYFRSK